MNTTASKLSGIPLESLIGAVIGLIAVGLFFFYLIRVYWQNYQKHLGKQGSSIPRRKPTLFNVRELIARGEKPMATKIYRQIFNVGQNEAQSAVDDLEKSMHQQG